MIQSIFCLLSKLWYMAIGMVGIGFLIGFHELGHYLFARLFGVRAPSFSIGMGPKLISKEKWGTVFSLSAIPLGGYVEIAGLAEVGQGDQKEATIKDNTAFSIKPYWQRILILLGGILFNILFAYITITGLLLVGAPSELINKESSEPIISTLVEDGYAKKIGLQSGDKITRLNNNLISSIKDLKNILSDNKSTPAYLEYDRNGNTQKLEIFVPESGLLGISSFATSEKLTYATGIKDAIATGFTSTNNIIKTMAIGIIGIFKAKNGAALGGPIHIINSMAQDAKKGLRPLLVLMVLISLNLALLNLIPVPIFDGGQIVLTTIESIIGKELPHKLRLVISYACWILVLGIFLYLSINDIYQLFIIKLISK